MVSGTRFIVAHGFIWQEEMHEAFIRLEKELTWPGLAGVGQWNDSYYYEVAFPHRGFPWEIIVSNVYVACMI